MQLSEVRGAEPEQVDGAPDGDDRGELGQRLDKLLRAAVTEATEVRENAERRAAALLGHTHVELERHERERREQWQQREAEVAALEERARAELAAARQRATEMVTEAEAHAQHLRGQAYLRATEIVETATAEAAQAVGSAKAEVERQEQLSEAARDEIRRTLRTLDGLRAALAYELDAVPPSPTRPSDDPHHRPDTAAAADRDTTSPVAAALGRRRGDHHRTRYSGLVRPDVELP